MGGSSCQPADLDLKKKKKKLLKDREELLLVLETYLWQIKYCLEFIQKPENIWRSHKWHKSEIIRWLDLMEKKIRDFPDKNIRLDLEERLLNKMVLLRGNMTLQKLTNREFKILNLLFKEINK